MSGLHPFCLSSLQGDLCVVLSQHTSLTFLRAMMPSQLLLFILPWLCVAGMACLRTAIACAPSCTALSPTYMSSPRLVTSARTNAGLCSTTSTCALLSCVLCCVHSARSLGQTN